MRYLSKKDIQATFSMRQAMDADEEALGLYSAGKTKVPLRTNIDIPKFNGQSLYMPGYVEGEKPALGVKIVSVYPNNVAKGLTSVPATMVTLDAETGVVTAILDGTYLTQLRTGAIQGVATELLSRPNAKTALLIGTGGQGQSQLAAMLTARKLDTVYIFDMDQDRAKTFVKKVSAAFADKFVTQFVAVASPNDVVSKVDIITTVTTSKIPTFDGSLVRSGTHINGIGAYTPEMHELPVTALQKADHIFVDTRDGVFAEAGDIITSLKDGSIKKDQIDGELGELINKTVKGRQNDQEVTVFKTVGTAAIDTMVADKIVRSAEAKKIGMQLD